MKARHYWVNYVLKSISPPVLVSESNVIRWFLRVSTMSGVCKLVRSRTLLSLVFKSATGDRCSQCKRVGGFVSEDEILSAGFAHNLRIDPVNRRFSETCFQIVLKVEFEPVKWIRQVPYASERHCWLSDPEPGTKVMTPSGIRLPSWSSWNK